MVDFAVGNDMDFAVVTGEACLQITQFRLTVKKTKKGSTRKLENITIATGFQSTMQQ